MARDIRIELDRQAVRHLLRSDEILADLERRGRAIAGAAGPGHEVQPYVGRNRARVTVRTATDEARRAEATDRRLTAAITAART